MRYLDTNIFIRALTGDDQKKKIACQSLFRKIAAKEVVVTTTEVVIADVVYVLSSKRLGYHLRRQEIRDSLYPLLKLTGIKLKNRNVYLQALDIYAAYPIDYEDALQAAYIQRHK